MSRVDASLPGADLVQAGLDALSRGDHTAEALLVASAAPRLRALGLDLPDALPPSPEHALYALLAETRPDAHSAYNALRRRMVSFQRALERARTARGLPVA